MVRSRGDRSNGEWSSEGYRNRRRSHVAMTELLHSNPFPVPILSSPRRQLEIPGNGMRWADAVVRLELGFHGVLLGFRAATNGHALEERRWGRRYRFVLRCVLFASADQWLEKGTAGFCVVRSAWR